MRLVRLDRRWCGRVLLVLTGRESAPGAVPQRGDRHISGEVVLGVVAVGAPEPNHSTGNRLGAFGGGVDPANRAGSDTGATDGVSTCHGFSLLVSGVETQAKLCGTVVVGEGSGEWTQRV